jgi:hypothetical protein
LHAGLCYDIHSDGVHLPHHAALKGDFRMKRQMGFAAMLVAAIALSALVVPAAADWPTYRHNPSRNATASAQLAAPLHLQWAHLPTAPPRRAWPEPGREVLKDFDIVREAGRPNRAVVRQFSGINVSSDLRVTPRSSDLAVECAPLLCGISVHARD